MDFSFAERMDHIGTEGAFEVLARARALEAQGKDIVHLEIGEPDFPTPANIVERAARAMREGATHYTPASGIMEVRESTAAYVERRTGVKVPASHVVLTPGSKNILFFALLSLVNPGDEVIYPDPGYPIYHSLINFIGGKAVASPIRERNDFRLDIDELRSLITDRTKVIIINTPANPTGGVLTKEDCVAIAELVHERNLVVISDEIYGRLTYGTDHVSLFAQDGMPERTILMDGMSKAWAMCGWRLGFGVMPEPIAKKMDTLMINTSSCAAAFTQWAATEAFESEESDAAVTAMVNEFHKRRDVIVDGLNAIPGFRCHRPQGAFYVFPNVEETGWNEGELAKTLLEEGGVGVLAGTAFGDHGKGYIRLSYANSIANIEKALDRITSHVASRHPVHS